MSFYHVKPHYNYAMQPEMVETQNSSSSLFSFLQPAECHNVNHVAFKIATNSQKFFGDVSLHDLHFECNCLRLTILLFCRED